eukprot:TRINITY_DN20656_c0_g1_i1.p1 TRINITY_DN20656_c0_g1~~TRINITY_DN20656_c0_g1_i1.p1  ORF type:complete len:135 (+),score=15.24 TRINITY_DN20656_c0_g1_i1:50-454(+)
MITIGRFLRCDSCQSDALKEESSPEDKSLEDLDEDEMTSRLISCDEEHLKNVEFFQRRQAVMHGPSLAFQVRRQVFNAQLGAACSILPSLHPALKELYEQLKDLCASSPYREHCERVCEFHDALRKTGHAVWDR